jgi:5'-nucleotidase
VTKRPLILLTNDDGILSRHLGALADALEAVAEVLVVGPERQRSAASHNITLHKPLRLTSVAERRYALSGTPADCVYVGILRLAQRLPTLVVSGINDGYNLGTDVFYSGTVAGAVEGALRGSVGVALSMSPGGAAEADAVDFATALVGRLLADLPAPGTVLNVNVPVGTDRSWAWTALGRRRYDDDVTERVDPRGRPYYWIGGGATGHDDIPGSDCNAVARGTISVTPMHLDLTVRGPHAAWDLPGFAGRGADEPAP